MQQHPGPPWPWHWPCHYHVTHKGGTAHSEMVDSLNVVRTSGSSVGWRWWTMNQIHRLSSGCHIAYGNVASDTWCQWWNKWVADSPHTPGHQRMTSVICCRLVAPFHRMSQCLFVVVIAVCYWKVASGCCQMVSYHCCGCGHQHHPSPW